MKIFLSHSGRDKPLIRAIIPELPAYIGKWLDEEQLFFGEGIEASLKKAIQDESDFVILFVSKEAVESRWVQAELKWALDREATIGRPFVLPVVLDQEAWEKIKPPSFRQRRFLSGMDMSETGIKALASKIQNELMGWIVRHYDQQEIEKQKAPVNVQLSGEWASTFTWEPRFEGDVRASNDTILVKQSGSEVSGETLEGEYAYSFKGRIVGDYLLGEWKGTKLPLFGVFQLKIDIDFLQTIEGYWIGTGARFPYHGKWVWNRERPKRAVKSTVVPRKKTADRKKTVRTPTSGSVKTDGPRKKKIK